MEKIIETKNLSHIYSAGTPFERGALKGVDFCAYEGEYLGIIGHTSSGKSTMIQHLNGLLKPTSGQVLYKGQDIWSDPKLTRMTRFNVGLVFQYPEYQLFEETVYKDIAFGPKNMGLKPEEVDRRVREAAGFVGLTGQFLIRPDILTIQQHSARGRLQQTVHLLHQSGLTGAGMSDDADKLSPVHGKRHIVQRLMFKGRSDAVNIV